MDQFDGIRFGAVRAATGEKNSMNTQRKEPLSTLLLGRYISLADKYLLANFLTHANIYNGPTL